MGRRQKIAPQSRNLELITSYPVISGKPKGKIWSKSSKRSGTIVSARNFMSVKKPPGEKEVKPRGNKKEVMKSTSNGIVHSFSLSDGNILNFKKRIKRFFKKL